VPDVSDWYSVAPNCVVTDSEKLEKFGSGFDALAPPYQDCHGFFTFGVGRQYELAPGAPGNHGGSTALYIITAIGFLVSIGFFIAWVWFENKKLWAQAMLLRAAGGRPAPGGVPPGPGPSQPPLAGPTAEPGQ
jgi:4-amino-4-deoxy-L-arabinose transferase-like glycosyltransferase